MRLTVPAAVGLLLLSVSGLEAKTEKSWWPEQKKPGAIIVCRETLLPNRVVVRECEHRLPTEIFCNNILGINSCIPTIATYMSTIYWVSSKHRQTFAVSIAQHIGYIVDEVVE